MKIVTWIREFIYPWKGIFGEKKKSLMVSLNFL